MGMNPEVKARWVAALRSGEYKQTYHKLADFQGGFCCLGVLCELYAQEHKVANLYDLQGEQAELPGDSVIAWAGVDVCNAKVRIDNLTRPLFEQNDGTSLFPSRTFSEIADAIEAQL